MSHSKLTKRDCELQKAFIRNADQEFKVAKKGKVEFLKKSNISNAKRALEFAEKHNAKLDLDLVGLTRIIIRSQDTNIICQFMLEIEGVNLSRLAYALTTIEGDWRPLLKVREKFPKLYSGPLEKRIPYLQDMEIIQQVLQ